MQRVEASSRDGREVEAVEVDATGLVGPYEGSTSEEEGIMPSSSDQGEMSKRIRKKRKRASPLGQSSASRSLQFRSLLSRSSALVQGDQGGPTVRTLASIRALQSLIQTETFEWEQATSDENCENEHVLDLSTLQLTRTPISKSCRRSDIQLEDLENSPGTSNVEEALTSQESTEGTSSGDVFLKPKLRCRKFIFKPFKRNECGDLEHDTTRDPVDVTIPEQLAASYGLYIWPCAPVLAWYVWLHQSEFVDKTVLELGSGTALPGLLCSKLGAKKVFLSDDFWQPNTLKNCHEAIKVNNLPESKATVLGLTWGEYSKSGLLSSQLPRPPAENLDYIIGSDLFFDPKVFEPLVATLAFLLGRHPSCQVLITVQERSADWSIEQHLSKWNLKCSYIYPMEFLAGTGIDESELIGGHTIFILKVFPS